MNSATCTKQTDNARWPKLSQNSRKTLKNYKTQEMLFIKLLSDYFSENSRLVFGKFENQRKTLEK